MEKNACIFFTTNLTGKISNTSPTSSQHLPPSPSTQLSQINRKSSKMSFMNFVRNVGAPTVKAVARLGVSNGTVVTNVLVQSSRGRVDEIEKLKLGIVSHNITGTATATATAMATGTGTGLLFQKTPMGILMPVYVKSTYT